MTNDFRQLSVTVILSNYVKPSKHRTRAPVWDYCYASAVLLFGMSTGDPIADRIREAIEASPAGLSRNRLLFHGHIDANRMDIALESLVALGAVSVLSEPTRGRPSTLWSAVEQPEHNENDGYIVEDEAPEEQ